MKFKIIDDIVGEVKRQAYSEMQKAINAAEHRASEILVKEREKFENILKETKKQVQYEATISNSRQEDNILDVSLLNLDSFLILLDQNIFNALNKLIFLKS